jgi:hypothetical protein
MTRCCVCPGGRLAVDHSSCTAARHSCSSSHLLRVSRRCSVSYAVVQQRQEALGGPRDRVHSVLLFRDAGVCHGGAVRLQRGSWEYCERHQRVRLRASHVHSDHQGEGCVHDHLDLGRTLLLIRLCAPSSHCVYCVLCATWLCSRQRGSAAKHLLLCDPPPFVSVKSFVIVCT